MKRTIGIVALLIAAVFFISPAVSAEDDVSSTADEVVEICADGIDNDGDGLADCDDPDCDVNLLCILGGDSGNTAVEVCNDGIDNDGDGLADCDDDDCDANLLCMLAPPENETCRPLPTAPSFFITNDPAEIESLFISAESIYVDQFDMDVAQVTIDIPCYEGPVDVFIAVEIPDGRMLLIENDGLMARDFVPYRIAETEAVYTQKIYSSLPAGNHRIYWMITPTLAGNFWNAFNMGLYDLGGHAFQLNVDAE